MRLKKQLLETFFLSETGRDVKYAVFFNASPSSYKEAVKYIRKTTM